MGRCTNSSRVSRPRGMGIPVQPPRSHNIVAQGRTPKGNDIQPLTSVLISAACAHHRVDGKEKWCAWRELDWKCIMWRPSGAT